MIVYSNSCSFGAPQGHETYGNVVARHHKAFFKNAGKAGACNRRIIRTTLRDLIELKEQGDDIIALIGLTFLSRTELWRSDLNPVDNDGHFHVLSIKHDKIDWSTKGLIDTMVPNIHELAEPSVQSYYKEWLTHYDREGTMTNLLTDILMLTGWLKAQNIQYVIFSGPDVFEGDDVIGYDAPFLSSLVEQVKQDKGILNPWGFSFGTFALEQGYKPKDYDVYGKHGHPGELAHKAFGTFLCEVLEIERENK